MNVPSLRLNVLANYGGHFVASALALALAPLYVKAMGFEVWGLVGIFALLSAWLNLLDVGLTPAITRAIAGLQPGRPDDARSAGELVRSVECVYLAVLACAAAAVWLGAQVAVTTWLNLRSLSVPEASAALAWMGVAVVLRLYENIYRAILAGMEQMVVLNTLSSAASVARWGGGLILVGQLRAPGADDLFAWFAAISAVSLITFGLVAHRRLRARIGPVRTRFGALWEVRRYAGGMAATTALGLLLSQIDKIVLSRVLPLADFGVYMLASGLADMLGLLSGPLYGAMLPRFVRLLGQGQSHALGELYLRVSQYLAVVLVPSAMLLVILPSSVVLAWSGDRNLAMHIGQLVALLAAGRMLNATMQLPAALQAAVGWTSLGVGMNLVALALLLPLVLLTVPTSGAIAYGWCWLALNLGYLLFGTALMHRRLLHELRDRWLRDALLVPIGVSAAMASCAAWLSLPTSRIDLVGALAGLLLVSITACACLVPATRLAIRVRLSRLARFK